MQTIWVEVHRWRGIKRDVTLFGPMIRLGFASIGISKFVLTDWLQAWHSNLQALTGKS